MRLNKLLTKKGVVFLLIFAILSFVGDRINFSPIIGAENQFFTLFQFFGPVAGAFLGPVVGILAVLISELANFLMAGKSWTLINLIRLLPMLFAVYYFGTKKSRVSIIVPLFCIALFVFHPVGREAWFYSLFWLIPITIKIFFAKSTGFLKSLGATFTAHAVGSTAWLYTVNMTAAQWIALIPVVIYERTLFALGITLSFIIINSVLDKLDTKTTSGFVVVDEKYALFSNKA